MDELKIKELLSAQRELLPEEQALLEEWYDQFPQHDDLTFASVAEKDRVKTEMKAAIYKQINLPEVTAQPRKSILLGRTWQVAAAVLLFISIAAMWMYLGKGGFQNDQIAAFIEVTAPEGPDNKLVVLQDSSRVWLMAGTTIKYPRSFDTRQRDIELVNGMAMFEVTHNEQSPFTVTTASGVKTTVLGTSFNISSFKNADNVTVSVLTGKVKVVDTKQDLGILQQDQQIVYSKESGNGKMQQINAHAAAGWVNGHIVLHDAGVDEIAQILEARYKVQVTFNKQDLSALRLNFQFTRETSLKEVLDIMNTIGDIKYEIRGSAVTLSR